MYLNSNQKMWLVLTAFMIAGFGAVPPCTYSHNNAAFSPTVEAPQYEELSSSEYNLILFLRPGLRVDVVRLGVIWLSAIAAGGALVIVSSDPRATHAKPPVVR